MRKKKERISNRKYTLLITFIICIFLSIIVYFMVNNNKTNSSSNEGLKEEYLEDDFLNPSVKPFDSEKRIDVTINNVGYSMTLANNLTALHLLSILPMDLEMEDLNNNEKYSYLSYSIANDNSYTGKIKKGDVLLYQSNCIVIFYKDLETDYLYTKIGHIDNLPDFNNESIYVSFSN